MNEQGPAPDRKGKRRWPLVVGSGIVSAIGIAAIIRPDIAAYVADQMTTGSSDGPSTAPTTAEPFPSVAITPTESQKTVGLETPTPTSTSAPAPVPSKGGKLKTFVWTLPDGTVFEAKGIETIESIQDFPAGHFNAAWVGKYAMACSSQGTFWVNSHSGLSPGNAMMPPDWMTKLKQKGLGRIAITTENGLSCTYEPKPPANSVVKFGSGPGTFADFVTGNNPLGRDLRDQNDVKPRIIFVSCDQTQGFDRKIGTSKNNGIVLGELVTPAK